MVMLAHRPATLPFVNTLPPTHSLTHRAYKWFPAVGTPHLGILDLATDRDFDRYQVTEFAGDLGGRCFRLDSLTRPGVSYNLRLAGPDSSCDCRGFESEATRRADQTSRLPCDSLGCKHCDACQDLIDEKILPSAGTGRTVQASTPRDDSFDSRYARIAAEVAAREAEMPECFRGLGGRPGDDVSF